MQRIAVALVTAALLQGCSGGKDPGAEPSKAAFDAFLEKRAGVPANSVPKDLRDTLAHEFAGLRAVAEKGKKIPGVQSKVDLAALEVRAHEAAVEAGVYRAPTDAELAAEYSSYVRSLAADEFHSAHVLVPTEGAASAIIVRLQAGEAFGAVARRESLDESKSRDGDIGWRSAAQLPKPYADALKELKPGEVTRQPVKTIYGWHVIKLIGTRPVVAPPLGAVKAQLAKNLEQKRYQEFVDEVVKAAGDNSH